MRPSGSRSCATRSGAAPELKPSIEGFPFNGGLVGATGYDVVRFFERLPHARAELDASSGERVCRARVAARIRSLDPKSRVAARGTRERAAGAARRGDPRIARRRGGRGASRPLLASRGEHGAARVPRRRAREQSPHQSRRHLSNRAVGPLRRTDRLGSFSNVPGPAAVESFTLYVLLRARRLADRRLLARGARPTRARGGIVAADRRHAAARRHARGGRSRSRRSSSPIRRKTPSTSCSSTSRATI